MKNEKKIVQKCSTKNVPFSGKAGTVWGNYMPQNMSLIV